MTHQQQAVELIERFRQTGISYFEAKQCALIAVDEILKAIPETITLQSYGNARFKNPDIEHWQAVKSEIEEL